MKILSTKSKRTFDTKIYQFTKGIKHIFNVENLELVHKHYKSDYELFPAPEIGSLSGGNLAGTDQGTVYHEKFYTEANNTDFLDVFKIFINL